MSLTDIRPPMRGPGEPAILGAASTVVAVFTTGFTLSAGLTAGFTVVVSSIPLAVIAAIAVASIVAAVALFAIAIIRAIAEDTIPNDTDGVNVFVDEGQFYADARRVEQADVDPNVDRNDDLVEVA